MAAISGEAEFASGLTEPDHGSDATWLETTAARDGGDWVINGVKRFISGASFARYAIVFARTSGDPGAGEGITAFIVHRHHRRYRITEGSEEIQIRNIAGHLFGFISR